MPLPVAQHCVMYGHTVAATPRLFGAEGAGVSAGAAAAGAAAGKGKKTERESAAEREAKEGAKTIQQQVRRLFGEEGKVEASSGSGLSNGDGGWGGRRRDNAAVHRWLLESWELAPAVSLRPHQHNTQHMLGYAVPAVSLQTWSLPSRFPRRLPERTAVCQTSSLLSSPTPLAPPLGPFPGLNRWATTLPATYAAAAATSPAWCTLASGTTWRSRAWEGTQLRHAAPSTTAVKHRNSCHSCMQRGLSSYEAKTAGHA